MPCQARLTKEPMLRAQQGSVNVVKMFVCMLSEVKNLSVYLCCALVRCAQHDQRGMVTEPWARFVAACALHSSML